MRRGAISLAVAAALAALVAAALATPAGAAFPGQNGAIAFTTYYLDNNENVYAIEPDGTGLRRLTAHTAQDDDAAWSPNGRRIAFASNRADPAGGGCEGLNHPCDYDIYAMSADGSNLVRLTDSPGSDRDPAWSPDGTKIVFSSTRDDTGPGFGQFYNAELYVMNADGTAETRITDDPGVDQQASWSPDGAAIAFRRAPCEFNCATPGIYRIAPDGKGLTQLASGSVGNPNWAPDGSKIAFTQDVNTPHIFTMNPDGSGQQIIFGERAQPAWSPDGAKIAFASVGIGHMNVDGSSATTLNTNLSEKPDWQPLVGPRRADYRNGPAFCRAERDFLGAQEFNVVYGNFGGCVSKG